MSLRALQSQFATMVGISAFAVIIIGVVMAQPWGDNYVYQDAKGYVALGLMLLFALVPYVGLLLCSRLFVRSVGASRSFMIGALLISIVGVAGYFHTAFINLDAQGGLIFLVMPVLQLLAGFTLVVSCALWLWLARKRGATR